jgi:hypothetical protein
LSLVQGENLLAIVRLRIEARGEATYGFRISLLNRILFAKAIIIDGCKVRDSVRGDWYGLVQSFWRASRAPPGDGSAVARLTAAQMAMKRVSKRMMKWVV